MALEILVFHDAGEECDDQVALWKLLSELNGAVISAVMCGKTREIQKERLDKWEALCKHINPDKCLIFNYYLADINFPNIIKYDAVLQIAPLFGFDSPNIKTDLYVLMGTVGNSVNCPKDSKDLFRRFEGRPGTIVVESAEAAKIRPTKDFIQIVPVALLVEMLNVGFRLMLCRCNPTEVYAEGLINCKVGRGANFDTVMNMFNATSEPYDSEDESNDHVEHTVVPLEQNPEIEYYVNSLAVKKEPEITMRLMGIMYRALDKVFGFNVPVITAGEWNKFLTSEQGVSARKKFDQVAMNHPEILNPLYDYHAATILLKKLKK